MKKNILLSLLFYVSGLVILSMVVYLEIGDVTGGILISYSLLLVGFSALVYLKTSK